MYIYIYIYDRALCIRGISSFFSYFSYMWRKKLFCQLYFESMVSVMSVKC